MTKFSAEALTRELTLPEAACLWCELPFSVITAALEVQAGQPFSLQHPEFNAALDALIEATDHQEIPTRLDESGYAVDVEHRTINRDDLRAWLEKHHPDHRPALLFPGTTSHAAHTTSGSGLDVSAQHPGLGGVLGTKELLATLQISRGTLDNWMRDRGFPQPMQAGPGASRKWSLDAVLDWKKAHEQA